MWEDKTNKNGGRWLLNLDKNQKRDGTLDNSWMETVSLVLYLISTMRPAEAAFPCAHINN
jgi:hypothetical protein